MSKIAVCAAFALAISFFSRASYAEYIRATNEDAIILISAEQEIKMGRSISKNVEKKFVLDDDALLQERIDKIGQRLVSVCDRRDIPYQFKVLAGEGLEPEQRINAFALPGGYVYIFRDMVSLLEVDDEIAATLAHEIGHIAAKHSIKRLQGSLGAIAFQLLASRMADDSGTASRVNSAMGLLMTSYSREDEAMADRLSVRYLRKAGFDQEAIISSLEKMEDMHRKAPIRKYTAYQTHPYTSERKAAVKREIYGRLEFSDYINTPAMLGKR